MSGWTPLTIRTDGKDGEKEWVSSVEAEAEKRGRQRIAIEILQEKRDLDVELDDIPALLREQAI